MPGFFCQPHPFYYLTDALGEKRTEKKLRVMRPDAITLLDDLTLRTLGRKHRSPAQELRNFEYYMTRGYALYRDHGQC